MVVKVKNSTDRVIDLSEAAHGDLFLVGTWDKEARKGVRLLVTVKVSERGYPSFFLSPEHVPTDLVRQVRKYVALLLEKNGRDVYEWAQREQGDRSKPPAKLYKYLLKECLANISVNEKSLQIGNELIVHIPSAVSSNAIDVVHRKWSPVGVVNLITESYDPWLPTVEAAKIQAELAL